MWHPRPPGLGLLPEPTTDGKLAALGVCGQTHEGDKLASNPNHPLYVYPITPVECLCMLGEVGGEPISFLLDTGAAVTLIGSDVWRRVSAKQPTKLQPWSDQKLVGVDGSPLEVHGQVHVTVVAQANTFETQALVVSPFTTEGILGPDFLKKHQATIDVRNRQLRLDSRNCTLSLVEARIPPTSKTRVYAISTISIPPNSEVEVMARLSQPVQGGTWLLRRLLGNATQPVSPEQWLVLSVTRFWCGCSIDMSLLRFTGGATLLLLN